MDKATVFGLIFGVAILAGALLLGNIDPSILLQPEALLVVFGGTVTAVMVSFSGQTLWGAFNAFLGCFAQNTYSAEQCVSYLTDVAGYARREGVLALEPLADEIPIPFIRKGILLMMDNRPTHFIRDGLSTDIEVGYREDMDYARVFEAAGGYAPTMGIIGAVIGLIHVVGSFSDPQTLGHGVAEAFTATLYGVALSNLFLLPIAGKLRQRARDTWFQKTLMLEGLISIHSGEHPLVTEEKLRSFFKDVAAVDTVTSQLRAAKVRAGIYGGGGDERDLEPFPVGSWHPDEAEDYATFY